jgi:thiol-disulfide isomerase/thioredoxin
VPRIVHNVGGLVVCVVVLAAAAVYGAVWRRRNGMLRVSGARGRGPRTPEPGPAAAQAAGSGFAARVPGPAGAGGAGARQAAVAGQRKRADVLTAAQLGRPLGSRATLVQFSTAFCAPCRATRRILAEVADMTDGVAHVEVDAEANLGLVRGLGIHTTPTVFVLGADGAILRRGTGQPRKPDVIAALGAITLTDAGQDIGGSADGQATRSAATTAIGVRGDSPDVPA